MSRSLWTLWGAVLGLTVVALALTGPAASRARARMQLEVGRLETAKAQAAEIARLRAQAPPWAARPAPAGGLATRVGEALSAAGLPAAALSSLSPEAELDAGAGGALKARKRRAVLTLVGVTLPRIGTFLSAWREREPGWTVTSVDLAQDSATMAPAGGGDLPLRANIALEALYVDGGGGVTRR